MSDEEKQNQGNSGESVSGYSFGLNKDSISSNDELAPNTMLPDLAPALTHPNDGEPNSNPPFNPNPPADTVAASSASQPAINASPEKFPLDEVITFSWNAMKAYFWPLTGVLTCNFIIMYIPSVTSFILQHASDSAVVALFTILLSLAGMVVHIVINIGTINVWLKIVDGDKITVGDVYTKINRAWDYALATFLYGAMVFLGYVCLIIPGVYLQIRFQFYPYFISESKAGPLQALKASYAVTNGAVAELFFLGLICYFMNWIGALCLLLGLVPAQIIQNVAQAKAYRMLRANTPLANMPEGLQQPLVLIPNSNVANH